MIDVRPAEPADLSALLDLIAEIDSFYGTPEPRPREEQERMVRWMLFGSQPAAHVLLAWTNGQLVGMAAYSILWPAVGVTQSLYLKELYVAERARNRGVGKTLMDALHRIAAKAGCSRLEWTTDSENVDAQRFYAGLGAEPKASTLFYRVELP